MSHRPNWPMADELTPHMRAALRAWPDDTGRLKRTIRALRIRGLLLPRGRSVLGDRVIAYLDKESFE